MCIIVVFIRILKINEWKWWKNKRKFYFINLRCFMDLFILWLNDLFVYLKMKNKYVYIIVGKDIFVKV